MGELKPVPLLLGRLFHGRYEVMRRLSSGGMGDVYEVIDQKTRRRRALKVMLPGMIADKDLLERFKQEATITAEIASDHLVETLDADVDAETGAPFVVMELLQGEHLGEALERRGALPRGEVIELLRQAARALDRTHAAGVVHRDLKPENLFVTRGDDGSPRLKVLDFGIAKIVAESGAHLATTRAMGTPLYMPPEQIRGDGGIGPRADLYALAHVAFTLLTGEAYWKEESVASPALYAIFQRILRGPEEPPTARARRRSGVALPAAFDGWFQRATALTPEDRFESAATLASALAAALGTAEVSAGASSSLPAPTKAPAMGSGNAGPWLALAALLAAGAVAWVLVGRERIAGAPAPEQPSASPEPLPAMTATIPPPAPASIAPPPHDDRPTPAVHARGSATARPPSRPVASGPSGGYDPTDTR